MDEKKIKELADILSTNKSVEFTHKGLFYQVFESCEYGHVVNIYSSNKKDEEGYYLEVNIVDGGLCTGNTRDAIEFML